MGSIHLQNITPCEAPEQTSLSLPSLLGGLVLLTSARLEAEGVEARGISCEPCCYESRGNSLPRMGREAPQGVLSDEGNSPLSSGTRSTATPSESLSSSCPVGQGDDDGEVLPPLSPYSGSAFGEPIEEDSFDAGKTVPGYPCSSCHVMKRTLFLLPCNEANAYKGSDRCPD